MGNAAGRRRGRGMKIDPPLKPSQLMASQPDASIWVSASAGTGKTKVLIARLLRLMLDGTAPEKILCITYTKTAAAEILNRLQEVTREWAIMDKAILVQALQNLADRAPNDDTIRRARSLFALILNAQGGMRIMTIHAFCQSILSRYPIEANVPTQFTVADEQQTSDLMNDAKHHLLWKGKRYAEDFLLFMDYLDEDNQNELLKTILAKRYYLLQLIQRFPTKQNYHTYLCGLFCIDPLLKKDELEKQFDKNMPNADLKKLLPILYASSTTMIKMAQAIENGNREDYCSAFVTNEKTPRKSMLVKAICDAHPWAEEFMLVEQQRVLTYIHTLDALNIVTATTALYSIVSAILAIYQTLKKTQGILDYEDQISATRALLCNSMQYQWVLYKLDNQIEHLLIDEAQDTSPAQWDIVDAVTDEFFAGLGRYESGERTVFVVGDEKQSIFSFQNADPQGFFDSGNKLETKALAVKQNWSKVGLHENFRSSPLILSLVDTVFADPAFASNITRGKEKIQHTAAHQDMPGKISLWPLAPYSKEMPTHIQQYRLAEKIAKYVNEQRKRPDIKEGDIMILVNRRNPMAPKLMKAFKDNDIPIMGPDRTVLAEHMAVKDCLSFMQFTLNAHDEYNTACLLKSPFIGFDDDALLDLRYRDTDKTLAQNLVDTGDKKINDYLHKHLLNAKTYSPVAFLHAILDQPCPNDEISGRRALIRHLGYDASDIIDSLIDAAYYYENAEPAQLQIFTIGCCRKRMSSKKSSRIRISRWCA
jgi:ATP-dependent helicase/nuclease subunit A